MITFKGIELYTLIEVGEILDLNVQTIKKMVNRKLFRSRVIGKRRIYVYGQDIKNFLEPIPTGDL